MKRSDNRAVKPFSILKEIQDYIVPLSEDEFLQLEKNILAEGCRDPLITWQADDQVILIDGHNRYKICEKHNIPFKVKKLPFKDLEEVKAWMVDTQMGRRNLTPDQMSYYRGLKYLTLRKSRGGYSNVLSKGTNELATSEFLAGQFNVSESTVKRDAKFAEGINIIQRTNPKLKNKILTGEVKVKKADIQILVSAKNPEKIVIKNEADLYNKAKIIRDALLEEVDQSVRKIEKEKISKAQETLESSEPAFLSREDKLRKIKGRIISAINKAINERDIDAIKELKKLIGRLEDQLFD
jgi:hypothetical protein